MSLNAESLTNVKPDRIVMAPERLGYPFEYHRIQGTPLYESDIKYIDNVIKADKIYRMIIQAYNSWDGIFATNDPEFVGKTIDGIKHISHQESHYQQFIETCNLIQFLGKFLDDSQCPARVKNFLYTFIGEQLGHYKRLGLYQDYVQHSFLTQRWLEICR